MNGGLRIRGLTVAIDGATILDGVDVDVGAGDWLAVIGPNGAGKTTMLRCLAGSIGYQGSVQLEGRDLGDLTTRRRAQTVAVVAVIECNRTWLPDLERRCVGSVERISFDVSVPSYQWTSVTAPLTVNCAVTSGVVVVVEALTGAMVITGGVQTVTILCRLLG